MHRLLYLSHCGSSVGGGEKQLHYLVTHLDRDRYQPIVACPDDGIFADQLRDSNIPTHILPLPGWRKAKSMLFRNIAAARLVKFAEQHGIHLVHTSDSWLNPYVWRIKRRLGIPAISHIRNIISPKRVGKYQFSQMDRIIAISEQTKAPLVQANIPGEKIDVILNCVDLSRFKPGLAHKKKNQKSTIKLRRFVVGMVGRIEPFKRQEEFILAALHVTKHCKDVSFLIIGEAHNIPEHLAYERELRQMVSKLKLTDYVFFTGHRTDMPRVMRGLDLLVTASAGSVIAEAMAAGIPVVGTPIGSASEMIDDSVTGWLVPLEPIEMMASKILLFAQNSDLCKQMGGEGRKRAEKLFSVDEHVRQVQLIYDGLLF